MSKKRIVNSLKIEVGERYVSNIYNVYEIEKVSDGGGFEGILVGGPSYDQIHSSQIVREVFYQDKNHAQSHRGENLIGKPNMPLDFFMLDGGENED